MSSRASTRSQTICSLAEARAEHKACRAEQMRFFKAVPEIGPDRLRLVVSGEVDFSSHRAFERVLHAAEQVARGRAITLDLSRVTFIDLSGWRAVEVARRRVARRDGEFTLVAPRGPAARVFEVFGRVRS